MSFFLSLALSISRSITVLYLLFKKQSISIIIQIAYLIELFTYIGAVPIFNHYMKYFILLTEYYN